MNNLVNSFVPVAIYNCDSLLTYQCYPVNYDITGSENIYQ